jgi:exodeoxyribonuclease VII small subunit
METHEIETNDNFNIDEALERLEEINNKLSDKNISLEESLKLYSEGTLLAQKSKEHLAGVEKQLQIVNE